MIWVLSGRDLSLKKVKRTTAVSLSSKEKVIQKWRNFLSSLRSRYLNRIDKCGFQNDKIDLLICSDNHNEPICWLSLDLLWISTLRKYVVDNTWQQSKGQNSSVDPSIASNDWFYGPIAQRTLWFSVKSLESFRVNNLQPLFYQQITHSMIIQHKAHSKIK
jgi:hypothetical protein